LASGFRFACRAAGFYEMQFYFDRFLVFKINHIFEVFEPAKIGQITAVYASRGPSPNVV
jgi:hypothetical protein